MTIEFKLPAVAEGVESVDIADILVSEGDTIEAGAIICEVETDKSVAEVDCPHAGTISKILVSTGQSVAVGSTLVIIEETAGASSSGPADAKPDASAAASQADSPAPPAESEPAAEAESE